MSNNVIECPLCPSNCGGTAIWLLNTEHHLKSAHPGWLEETDDKAKQDKQTAVKEILKTAKGLRGKAPAALLKDQAVKKRKRGPNTKKKGGPKHKKHKPDDEWVPG